MPISPYSQLLNLHAKHQKSLTHWQVEIDHGMETLRDAFSTFLGVDHLSCQDGSRYVEWETPSCEPFRLGAPDVVRYINGTSVVHANITVFLVSHETLSSVCHCPVQIRYRPEKGVEYRVMRPKELWLSMGETLIARMMAALVQQLNRQR